MIRIEENDMDEGEESEEGGAGPGGLLEDGPGNHNNEDIGDNVGDALPMEGIQAV